MRVFVDATHPQALWRLWGMSLLERVLRQLVECGVARVSLRASADWRAAMRSDRVLELAIDEEWTPASPQSRCLVLDAAAVYDLRLLARLLVATGPTRVRGIVSAQVIGGAPGAPVETISLEALPSYLPNLRRHRAPYVLPIRTAEDLAHAEQVTFEAVYKGVTDVITKYVYPPIVKTIVRWLAPTPITPNQVTAVSMVLSFGAIPVFATGHLGLGIVMGLVMSVLDSVDGKLARLTLRVSKTGNWMDHGSDFIYFAFWLAVVGWGAGVGIVRWLLPLAWLADKSVVGIFKLRHDRELNDWAPIDAAFRLVVIRRNIFLVALGVGVLAGRPDVAVAGLAAWTLVGLALHLVRAIWIEATGEPPTASRLHGGAS